MLSRVILLSALTAVAFSCDTVWPNGTDKALTWFPSCAGAITFYSLSTQDQSGKAEYPITLTKPLVIITDINNPKNVYESPNLKQTINLWSWGGLGACQWSTVPTLGLLSNLDACTNGVPCPVKTGRQTLPITMDFTGYDSIIKLLKDDSPYQLEMVLNDNKTKDKTCVIAQARTYTKVH
ncbi:unnamed protein product, partial [Mesorhabditis belari]|uniref:MD-2-related lipid-recognition domain-containing protein n=1 Tax=Mesorhabditis belari TaxID=2138241 RepID=A0AAF3E8S1_9BILA